MEGRRDGGEKGWRGEGMESRRGNRGWGKTDGSSHVKAVVGQVVLDSLWDAKGVAALVPGLGFLEGALITNVP